MQPGTRKGIRPSTAHDGYLIHQVQQTTIKTSEAMSAPTTGAAPEGARGGFGRGRGGDRGRGRGRGRRGARKDEEKEVSWQCREACYDTY